MTTTYQPTSASILAAARREGLNLQEAGAWISDSGLDFLAVFARDDKGVEWVARAPRRSDVLQRARNEAKVLDLVKRHLPVAVPDWRIVKDDLIAYPKMPGVPAAEINMETKSYDWVIDPAKPAKEFLASSGAAFAALHAIPHAAIAAAGFATPSMAAVRAKIAGQLDTVKRELGAGKAQEERWRRWLDTDSYWPEKSTFVHGDLHPGHMLVDRHEKLVGLLDWTEGEVADPSIDLSVAAMTMGEAFPGILAAYAERGGVVGPRLAEHVQEHIAFYPVKIGLFALSSGLEEYRVMAKEQLGSA